MTPMQLLMYHAPRTMVQVYFITLGDRKYALLGPVTHCPELGIEAAHLQKFEFGDILPASDAAKFLAGEDRGVVN